MASANASAEGLLDQFRDDKSCELLGPTALVVQAILGVVVLLSLVYKRHREIPKRPWRIWLFDVSKQVVGQMFVHGANVFLSDLISQHTAGNACVFYCLHILLDTTLGVACIYVILRVLTHVFFEILQLKGFESGVYGDPPSFKYWPRQAALYVLSLMTMKLLVIGLLILFPFLFTIGEWLLSWTWTGDGDALQVIFTMGIFPTTMNILQFWLIDSIVKASTPTSVALENSPNLSRHPDREPLFRAPSDDEDDGDDYQNRDVENQLSLPRSHSRDLTQQIDHKSFTTSSTSDEHKSTGSTSDQPADQHSYPPSLSSSLTSTSSSSNQSHGSPRPAHNLLKKAKRRPPPAPLSIRSAHTPAVNSPSVAPPYKPASVATIPIVAPIPEVGKENEGWAETWEESDDWERRVDEEGPKVPVDHGNLVKVWSNPIVRVSS